MAGSKGSAEARAVSTAESALLEMIERGVDRTEFQELNWTGTFGEYLGIVEKDPKVIRNAFQRIYDMIASHGVEERVRHKERVSHYHFFDDPIGGGRDAVFGLDKSLARLVACFKSASHHYGTERRVLLLHGPVGSSKSTIARLLKRGLEHYSKTPQGILYTFQWLPPDAGPNGWVDCPMHEEPLRLVPPEARAKLMVRLNEQWGGEYRLDVKGSLCPFCRWHYRDIMRRTSGDWGKMAAHVRVKRLVLSEDDRIGIGTFQPKDEKNQDSTELTGDINYRKIAEFGTDSDPRAFNFDGEFNVANRGLIEFIEVLKLDVAFLYDLLGASQEHAIKPKKFAQTDIDEVLLGHSVAGNTPIAYRHMGVPRWTTLESLHGRFAADARGVEVMAWDFAAGHPRWTPVRRVIAHPFDGELLTTSQKWGAVETTPNHSIYDRDGKVFYPEDRHEVLAARALAEVFAPGEVGAIDAVEGVAGFVRDDVRTAVGGGKLTRPARPGWARLAAPRFATAVQALYDPVREPERLEDLLTVLLWYATEGHVNGRNGGIVITQANPDSLERVRAAYARITTAQGVTDIGAKTDSCWRLYLGSAAIAALARHHCGEHSINKRLPDFLFRLPRRFLQHAFDELMRTDGTRKLSRELDRAASADYRANFFEYKTISPLLAAQVGTLASLLGHDYSIYRAERPGRAPAWRVRYCSGSGKPGGRHRTTQTRLHRRPAAGAMVYDIECVGLHNFVCGVGNLVCHNTNEPEYRRLQSNELMEAFRDRTVKIDIPYNTILQDEIKIYAKDFNAERIEGKHIAPHTIEIAAMWAVLTRLEEPKNAQLSLLQKLKLYNGKTLPGFTEDNIRELREAAKREGLEGISPRYVQDKISNALVADSGVRCVNPFMVMNELEEGLRHHALLTSDETRKRYGDQLAVVKQEYEDIVKNEVQRAISSDKDSIQRLCANYVDNIKAYTQKEKVRNKYTGQDEEPDERLMRSIEEKIDIPDNRKDDFRREIMNYIGALAIEGRTFDYTTNERLQKALELKLFEDQKDTIKLTSLVSSVVDRETQEKIDVVKTRLTKDYGYCDVCATDVLHYVAGIFARGDIKE